MHALSHVAEAAIVLVFLFGLPALALVAMFEWRRRRP